MSTYFTPAAFKFLKGLKRTNDREWFNARKDVYETELKAPMLALIDEVSTAMESFAPEHVRPANKIMMRIYRDTRFAKDKRPYKHHVSAWWSARGMEKTSGGGFYLQVSPAEVMISSGCYMPEREQLLAIRRWLAENHEVYRAMLKKVMKSRKSESAPMELVEPQALTRMPKGFPNDHPADELLRAHTWGVHRVLPGDAALSETLLREILSGFRQAAPLVHTLNSAITGARRETPRPLF